MKNKKNNFPIFFSSYGENSSKFDHILNTKITLTRKIKIGKIRKFDFSFVSEYSASLMYNVHLNTFEKKKLNFFLSDLLWISQELAEI